MGNNENISKQTGYNITSVSKAFQLIDLLAPRNGQLSVQTMAKKLDISPSSVIRLLQTMQDAGYVEIKKSKSSPYILSNKFYRIANVMLGSNECVQKYLPVTYKVAEKFNAIVNINTLFDGNAIMLTRTAGHYSRTIDFLIGAKTPAYSGSAGKVMLSLLDDRVLDMFLKNTDFEKLQRNTITNNLQLREELQKIKKNGYATDIEERILGVVSISFPILDSNARPHAFTVIMPINRKKELFAPSTIEYIREKLSEVE